MAVLSFFIAKVLAVSVTLPGFTTPSDASANPGNWVQSFYNFALLLSGVLAFGVIVYGGVRYAASGGNPSKQAEAKSVITGALLGLLLLAGAYIVLYTINPNILSLKLPAVETLKQVPPPPPPPPSGGGGGLQACPQTCTSDANCSACGKKCLPPVPMITYRICG